MRGKRYLLEKRDEHSGRQNDARPGKTSERLAKEYGVSPRTIERDAKFAEAVDKLPLEGKTTYSIAKELKMELKKLFEAAIPQDTLIKRADRRKKRVWTNVHKEDSESFPIVDVEQNLPREEKKVSVEKPKEEEKIKKSSLNMAARRIGELVPEKERGGKPDRGSNSQSSAIEIPHQRLSEFRKLAEIPLDEFKERIEMAKIKDEKITYNKILRGDWYQSSETPSKVFLKYPHFSLDKVFPKSIIR